MPAERSAVGFGAMLREARERHRVTLRQIADATKISASVLEALERNDVSRLPGGLFSRAFVRSYAVQVGLDPEETVREFIAAFPEQPAVAARPKAQIDTNPVEPDRRAGTTAGQLLALSVPVAIGVWLFGMSVRRIAPAAVPAATVTSAPVPAAPPAAPIDPAPHHEAPPSAVVLPTAGTAAVPAAKVDSVPAVLPEPVPLEQLNVAIGVTRPCWIFLTVDGEKTIERLLRPGDERTLAVQHEMVLTAGDAAAVALTINGLAARPLGRAGQVVTARLNAANFKNYLRPR
jgi:cytoskeletal protein RodZ